MLIVETEAHFKTGGGCTVKRVGGKKLVSPRTHRSPHYCPHQGADQPADPHRETGMRKSGIQETGARGTRRSSKMGHWEVWVCHLPSGDAGPQVVRTRRLSGKRDTLQKNRERSPTNLVQTPAPPCDSPVALRGLLYLSESKLPHQ